MLARLLSYLGRRERPVREGRFIIETLEDRIAPATFVNSQLVTYTDTNGDLVGIKTSASIFTKATAGKLLIFDTGGIDGTNTAHQQLRAIDLTSLDSKVVSGVSISVIVEKAGSGDGLVNVGLIDAAAPLGHVTVQGDLGRILAGTTIAKGNISRGLASLTVDTLGGQGIATQGSGNLTSIIYGAVGSITVQKDMTHAKIEVNSNATNVTVTNGNIGVIKIGGSIVGGAGSGDGSITCDGSVRSITIGGDLSGGSGADSASLQIGGRIGSLTVRSLTGYVNAADTSPMGAGSASVSTGAGGGGGIGTLKITGDVTGGEGQGSGFVGRINTNSSTPYMAGGKIGSATIAGKLAGGAGDHSGEIDAASLGSVTIGKGVIGAAGQNSGSLVSGDAITSLAITTGGIVGGTANGAGFVNASGTITTAVVHGDIAGSATSGIASSGEISALSMGSVTLYGSLMGGASDKSGAIIATTGISKISLLAENGSAGSVIGGDGTGSGQIAAASIGKLSIAGQVKGAGQAKTTGTGQNMTTTVTGTNSGLISVTGSLGAATIGGGIVGGLGVGSGDLTVTGSLTSLTLPSLLQGAGANAGRISVGGDLATLKLTGGASAAATFTGSVLVTGSVTTATVTGDIGDLASVTASDGLLNVGGSIKTLSVSGSLLGGAGNNSGQVIAGADGTIGRLTITGDLTGGSGAGSGSVYADSITSAGVGDIIGGIGQASGAITTFGAVGTVAVTGAGPAAAHGIIGNTGANSGAITAGSTIKSITVTGALKGGAGAGSGVIASNSIFAAGGDTQGNIGSISISGDVTGGTGQGSGLVSAAGDLTTVSIGGNVMGGIANQSGGIIAGSQPTSPTGGAITTLSIKGALQSPAFAQNTGTFTDTAYVHAARIGAITIGSIGEGSIAPGNNIADAASIRVAEDIGRLTVTNGITGASVDNPIVISAAGQVTPGKTSDMAIGGISIGSGGVSFANILAGYDPSGSAANGAASIGAVVDGGSWSGTNLVAGVQAPNNHFGSANATLIPTASKLIPSIASVVIKGSLVESSGGIADTFGIVAKVIGSYNGQTKYPIQPTADTVVREVTA